MPIHFSLAETLPILIACGVSLSAAMLLVWTKEWHGHLSMDHSVGVQKFHTDSTPRVGGLPLVLGVLVAYFFLPASTQQLLFPMLMAAIPAFASGLIEDLTKRVSVRTRLLCTIGSGLLACWLTGYAITRVDLPGADWLLSFGLVSLVFTALGIGTMTNAINIIDGFNGLSGGSLCIMLMGLATLAASAGDQNLALICLVIAAAVFGFLVMNWPFGKIFLGDGGAYFAGFSTAWLAISLAARNPGISPWAALLVCAYPVMEVFFSIARRRYRQLSPGSPDRLHLHSLVRKRLAPFLLPKASNLQLNSVTGALMWPISVVNTLIALAVPGQTPVLITGLVITTLLYWALYTRLIRFGWGLARA